VEDGEYDGRAHSLVCPAPWLLGNGFTVERPENLHAADRPYRCVRLPACYEAGRVKRISVDGEM